MDIETFRTFCLSLPSAEERMPFQGFFRNSRSILVFYIDGKIFCLFDIEKFDNCTIKCNANNIEELKQNYLAVDAPFNFSPKHWISVGFNQDLSDKQIFELVEESYTIVKKNR
jgi:predicted DNA-binding protein (MmcQ/YjbR family)